ncbi:hypothetical protein HPG69_002099, partial [Diceros bicornis minor]
LNCSYTVSYFGGLQWYRQDPGKGPELLFLLYPVGDEKQKERLRATVSKEGRVSSKQEVGQSPEALSVREGERLALNCSYSDSAIYSLQWFRQDSGKGLTSLLIQSNQREQTSGRIKASLDKSLRHCALYIAASQPGARLELRCNYSSSVPSFLFWYVQCLNQGLQLLPKYTSGNSLVSGIKSFEAEIKKSETSFHLRKPSAHWSDSAKYFCALRDTVPGLQGQLKTHLA